MQLPAPQNPKTWPNQAQQTLGFLGIYYTGRLCKITSLIRATRSAHGMPIMISLHKVATQEINTFVRAKTVCHFRPHTIFNIHYNDVIMGYIASGITGFTIVYSAVYSGADQRKLQSSASLAFVRRIHWGLVNSSHKLPGTRKMFPFEDVIM